ncbi:MAG: hypothetical protein HY294_09110 [Candidatus Rokubacteria bacterium]|nr:hypothetical protein [Candidatus Rokubacteria bacterium]
MAFRALVLSLIGVILVLAVAELSCLTDRQSAAAGLPPATTASVDPALPVVPDAAGDAPALSFALTR